LPLTKFGVWLGLPINMEVVFNDIKNGFKIKVE